MRLVYHGDFRCSGLARHRGQDEASRTARRHGAVARGKRTPSHQRGLTRIMEMKASRSEPRTRKGGSESERIRKNSWQSHDATATDPVSKGHVEQGSRRARRRRAAAARCEGGSRGGSRTPIEVTCECPPWLYKSIDTPTNTGSGTSVTPNRSWTRARTSRASATTSAAAAPPRFTMASVWRLERPTFPR